MIPLSHADIFIFPTACIYVSAAVYTPRDENEAIHYRC